MQELPSDDYSAQLTREYAYLAHKFELQPSEHLRWKMLRMRPGNFPHVRIAQLANLYHRSQGMLSQLLLASTVKELRDLLRGGTSLYWLTHYVFGEPSPARPKTLSDASIDLLIINTVIPFLYAYGKHKGEERLTERAGNLLEQLKPENNYIIRLWKECGLQAAHAGDSQALIQLKRITATPRNVCSAASDTNISRKRRLRTLPTPYTQVTLNQYFLGSTLVLSLEYYSTFVEVLKY